jgi:GNAT superfamily N-acetyltransferase
VFELRTASAADIAEIWAVRTAAIKAGCRGYYADDDVHRWADVAVPSAFPQVLAETNFYVIGNGGRIVGFGFLDPALAEIGGMFVHPDFHGQGLGRRILTALEGEATRARLRP